MITEKEREVLRKVRDQILARAAGCSSLEVSDGLYIAEGIIQDEIDRLQEQQNITG